MTDLAREPGSPDVATPMRDLLDGIEEELIRSGHATSGARRLFPWLRHLADVVDEHAARIDEIRLMIRGLAYEPVDVFADDEGKGPTLFGIPVVIRDGKTNADIVTAIDELDRGLSSEQVVDALVNRGLVARRAV